MNPLVLAVPFFLSLLLVPASGESFTVGGRTVTVELNGESVTCSLVPLPIGDTETVCSIEYVEKPRALWAYWEKTAYTILGKVPAPIPVETCREVPTQEPPPPTPDDTIHLGGADIETGRSDYDRYDSIIIETADRQNYDYPLVVKALIYAESTFNEYAVSSDIPCGIPSGWSADESHSFGLGQSTPACNPHTFDMLSNGHPNLAVDKSSPLYSTSVFNPVYNINHIVEVLIREYDRNKVKFPACSEIQYLKMSLASYNSGHNSVTACGEYNDRADRYLDLMKRRYTELSQLSGNTNILA